MTTLSDQLVVFRGGFSASWSVVSRLLDLEARGARFVALAGGQFRVVPADVLTPEDTEFLRAHRAEVRRVLAYQADDSHLFTDRGVAQALSGPTMRDNATR